jgi:hypothetical protein
MYNPGKNNSNLKWNVKQFNGEWIAGKNSGNFMTEMDFFTNNGRNKAFLK